MNNQLINKIFSAKYFYPVIAISIINIFIFLVKYTDIIAQINTIQFKKPIKDKYVIYECTNENLCGGWGDRLKGIMSSYAWSLITNRKFLIKHTRPC